MRTFTCLEHGEFKSNGYDNPVFLADRVADCPDCGTKCWEATYKITVSEYERLKKAGIDIRLAD